MFKHQFIELVKQPKAQLQINQQQLAELDALIKEYPFFQSAHLLYTKGLHNTNAINYTKQLRKTAIVANSRGILYELLHQKNTIDTTPEINVANEKIKVVEQQTVITEKENTTTNSIELEKRIEQPINNNPVTITNSDIKVVYVNTVPTANTTKTEEKPAVVTKEIPNNELNILKDVENETTATEAEIEVEQPVFDEQKLNSQIETEISRGIIQSYVETDIIKTPELTKEKEEKPLSFTDWLEKVKKESGTIQKAALTSSQFSGKEGTVVNDKTNELKNNTETNDFKQKKHLIDKIIEADPGRIKLGNQKFFTPQQDAKQSLLQNEHLVTETLAKIYALQGNNAKAIRAYEILSLKFPQKSVYFATLIEKIKQTNNK